jgi:hypothetical protein
MHQNISNIEFIVIDNNPDSAQGKETKILIENDVKGKYIPYTEKQSSFVKYEAVKHATGKYYLGLDCHVLLMPNSIKYLLEYFEENAEEKKEHEVDAELFQGEENGGDGEEEEPDFD